MQSTIIQVVGITAGILTSASFIPQLVKTVKTKEAEDLSAFMLISRGVGLALWIVYGVIKSDIPILVTFAFAFVINTAVSFLKVKYGREKDHSKSKSLK
jgi:MtN3 and saliva related transmembrane protein